MEKPVQIGVAAIHSIDEVLGGVAWAEILLGLGDPSQEPCAQIVLRIPVQYDGHESIAAIRARIWREGVTVVRAIGRALDPESPPSLERI